jgi:hypothetical protein
MSVVAEYNFFLSSYYRNLGSDTTPKWKLREAIILSNPNNWFTVKCLSFDIPFSFKTINATNNVLPITMLYDLTTVNTTITLTAGNYSIISLLSELETKLNNAWALAGFPTNRYSFFFTYDRENGKATLNIIHNSGNKVVEFILHWTQNDLLAPFFGFDNTTDTVLYIDTSGDVFSTNFISPYHVTVLHFQECHFSVIIKPVLITL